MNLEPLWVIDVVVIPANANAPPVLSTNLQVVQTEPDVQPTVAHFARSRSL